jgi:hypothetical protein
MRCCIDYCLICRCPPPICRAKNWSQDATNQTRNSSQHRIRDFAVGLLAGLVEYHLIRTRFGRFQENSYTSFQVIKLYADLTSIPLSCLRHAARTQERGFEFLPFPLFSCRRPRRT